MEKNQLMIFDDGDGKWGPLCDCRAVFCLRTGIHTTYRRIERVLGRRIDAVVVPTRLLEVTRSRYHDIAVNPTWDNGFWLCVNGRWPALDDTSDIRDLEPDTAILQQDGRLVAACVRADHVNRIIGTHNNVPDSTIQCRRLDGNVLLERPWHILDRLSETVIFDCNYIDLPRTHRDALSGVIIKGDNALHVHQEATVWPTVTIDLTGGPVAIDRGACIYPHVFLQGPCYIGPHTVVNSHAAIRAHTVIGPVCKVGGEISASIIHGHTNKSHDGFLGDSLVGAWCNFGAGTTVSNLKNTYGTVRVKLSSNDEPQHTGRTFHGAVIGDFVRLAIGTRLPTGAVVGSGAMIACSGFAPKVTPPFSFHTDKACDYADFDKFISTASAMMKRRGMTIDDNMKTLLRACYDQNLPGPTGS